MQQSTEMGGRGVYLFGILIEPSCSHIFKIRLTATPVKAPWTKAQQHFLINQSIKIFIELLGMKQIDYKASQ